MILVGPCPTKMIQSQGDWATFHGLIQQGERYCCRWLNRAEVDQMVVFPGNSRNQFFTGETKNTSKIGPPSLHKGGPKIPVSKIGPPLANPGSRGPKILWHRLRLMLRNICHVDQSDGRSDIPDILDFLAQESRFKTLDPSLRRGVVWGRDYVAW